MKSKSKKISAFVIFSFAAFAFGCATFYYVLEPVKIVWGFFVGTEIHSRASFPARHMARIYSAWGIGEQSLIFSVDGRSVYRTDDFAPGNVREKIVWDASGNVVTFIALGQKIFTYNTETGVGTVE